MPLPGLHPSSRSPSLESFDELVELGVNSVVCEDETYMLAQTGENGQCRSATKLDPELNEVLNLNASIYDLTVQYSCLACSRTGGEWGVPGLLTVLILEVLNVYVQMKIVFEVNFLIALPAKARAQHLYSVFTDYCYSDSEALVYNQDVIDSFERWEDTVVKSELCQFPLTAPDFFILILLIWTFYLTHELKQTLYFWGHIVKLAQPADGGRVTFFSHGENYIITHMSRCLKLWISITVFLPKLVIALVLWWIGAGWLTATRGIDNLVLNSLALTFICEVDELMFRTCISEVAKSCLEQTKLPLPSFKYTPTAWVPAETLSTCAACVALAYFYLYQIQDAIPDYRFDLTAVCRSHISQGR